MKNTSKKKKKKNYYYRVNNPGREPPREEGNCPGSCAPKTPKAKLAGNNIAPLPNQAEANNNAPRAHKRSRGRRRAKKPIKPDAGGDSCATTSVACATSTSRSSANPGGDRRAAPTRRVPATDDDLLEMQDMLSNLWHSMTGEIEIASEEGDEIITDERQLQNVFRVVVDLINNEKSLPLMPADIGSLPTVQMTREDLANGEYCGLCHGIFPLHETVSLLPCSHIFHGPCITEWLAVKGMCPRCRCVLHGSSDSPTDGTSAGPCSSAGNPAK